MVCRKMNRVVVPRTWKSSSHSFFRFCRKVYLWTTDFRRSVPENGPHFLRDTIIHNEESPTCSSELLDNSQCYNCLGGDCQCRRPWLRPPCSTAVQYVDRLLVLFLKSFCVDKSLTYTSRPKKRMPTAFSDPRPVKHTLMGLLSKISQSRD